MKKKTLIIVAILIVIAVFAALIIPMLLNGGTGNEKGNDSATVSTKETEMRSSTSQDSKETTAKKETTAEETKKEMESGKNEEKEKIEEGDSSGSGSSSGGSAGSQGSSSGTAGTSGQSGKTNSKTDGESDPNIPAISFPYSISGTDLVVEQIRSYDGYFIEDASDSETSGITAIVVKNNGGDLEFAGIGISQGSRSLGFSASQIPAGATVIIQEQNKAAFSSDPYYSATATTTPVEKFEMSEELVTVKDNGDNSLIVSNNSDKTLSDVKIFFKNYLPDEDIYVGGITYTITMTEELEPGASIGVSASHYDSQYSKVVEVQAE